MICLGHSHINCVALAADAEKATSAFAQSLEIVRLDKSARRKSPLPAAAELPQQVLARISEDVVFSIIGGSTHTALSLMEHPQPFDFILPEEPDLPLQPEAELLPYDLIRTSLAFNMAANFDVLERLVADAPRRILQIESPPPVADEVYIAGVVGDRDSELAQRPVAPRALRYKMWRLHSLLMRERCAELDVEFVPAPPESMDPHGFLKPGLYANATHGNRDYGRMVLRCMEAAL